MPAKLLSRWKLEPVVVVDDAKPSHASAAEEDPDDEVTGRILWDCTAVLWDLVADPNPGNMFTVRGKHVIELGAGTGALSVGLARAGAASVACTDLPCHLARIERTVRANTRSNSYSCDEAGKVDDGGGGDEAVAGADKPGGGSSPPIVVQGLRWGEEGDLVRVRAQRKEMSTTKYIRSSGSRYTRCNGAAQSSSSSSDGGSGGGGGTAPAGTVLNGCAATEAVVAAAAEDNSSAFDVIVLSEVLYWPALDLLQEDTREPLRRTLLGLSKPGTKVILVYKERWPHREKEFLKSCEGSFEVRDIPASLLALPVSTNEDAGSSAVRAVVLTRLPPTSGCP